MRNHSLPQHDVRPPKLRSVTSCRQPSVLDGHNNIVKLVNARRMREGYCYHSVCLCVCLSVCYQSSAIVRRLRDKLNLPDKSSLNLEGFQLADFAKTLSFPKL